MKLCTKAYKLCQSLFKTMPKQNKPKTYCQRCLNICQSEGISQDLITLVAMVHGGIDVGTVVNSLQSSGFMALF